MKFFNYFLVLLLLGVTGFVKAQSKEDSPENLIKNIFNLAQKENPLKNDTNKKELDSYFDFHQMSLAILGDEVKKRSSQDLVWFENSIKEIITKTVYPKAPDFLTGVKITYQTTLTIDETKAVVPSIVSKKGEKTEVSYTLTKKNGNWKVVDVSLDEESWVRTISDKMKKSLKEKGWSGVKELLNTRIKNLNKKV